ncbi:WD domain G-beta repeat family protein [Babesia bovis T2Bo]|uniref:WD domain G-beta repeat family protein n=1 Tax=Babesia bovis T2Bo TaxID=484906 RepID=UPI001C35457E|nr:WD domain G-beta repeat family protein [Babesia bovis T2Bo]EDO08463.2 WD domain G-beta repeat family protein [Babesia bovis T2Bo]
MEDITPDEIAPTQIHAELENGTSEEYTLDDTSFMLPTNIDRAGLSRMINDMLNLEKHVAFDILFKDEPLRTSLAEKLQEHGVKSETTIKLVYILAITEPELTEVDNMGDWITGIAVTNDRKHFATACYEGQVALFTSQGTEKIGDFKLEQTSSIGIYSDPGLDKHVELVCGHMDGKMDVYFIDTRKPQLPSATATSDADDDTVKAIALDNKGQYIAAAGHSKIIYVYNNQTIVDAFTNVKKTTSSRSKRAIETNTIEPIFSFQKHNSTVTSLKFLDISEPLLLSAAIDGQIAIWSIKSGAALTAFACGRAITCIDISNTYDLVYTGHEEGTIAIWELRDKSTGNVPKHTEDIPNCNLSRKSSTLMFDRLTTGIITNPKHENIVAAVSLDGNAALIDRRYIKIPLQTVSFKNQDEPDRCTGAHWTTSQELMCTTAAGKIHKIIFKELE